MAVFLMMFDVEFVNGREEGVPKPNMHYSPFGVVPPLRPVPARMSGGGRVIEGMMELWTMGLVGFIFSIRSCRPRKEFRRQERYVLSSNI
ncbi:uncharacterized protein K444DRAFT_303560 [Hyaloscypha bicolor E]|uniref:Uncharacterized protein n=1 Tax=Hyaloscypha bicolor E TaxID=1095630 RepID=A0A2J6TN81_9HELO|nr:uncharacterized protein K444DRAFT_303560 [Hyaloscypha bicolor E]PMD64470.1 hypothetical protein K444DRAFT_303560 [Hyaloscypha bicolor E]